MTSTLTTKIKFWRFIDLFLMINIFTCKKVLCLARKIRVHLLRIKTTYEYLVTAYN